MSVKVKNKVPDQDLSIHWHGVEQMGTPYMDGVPMITQCPITYGSTYEYAFIASSPGTFFYHSDSGKCYDINKRLSDSVYFLFYFYPCQLDLQSDLKA